LAALGAGFAAWKFIGDRTSETELAAKAELTSLGALVAMDAQRKHVASVNLSTLKSPDTLDRAIELMTALPRLASLNVDGTKFRDEHAVTVGRLSGLQDLVLNNTAITDLALERLEGLPQLKTIHLAETAVTNAGMPSLGRLQALNIIVLAGTKVTSGFEPLVKLPALTWLDVRRLSLDAAAIAALGDCQNLSRLTLSGTSYPPEALKLLTQKRPNLSIDR
jgi:Leucine-rich repeat (LRR) protein